MTRTQLSRRTFLRGLLGGAAVSIALPPLEIMFNRGPRASGDVVAPTRFGVWFWGNGVRRAHWIPDVEGEGWNAKAELLPLETAGLRPWLHVLTGLEIKTATHPHHSGMAGIMTGARYQQVGTTRDTIVSTFAYPSVDQVAADFFAGQTPYRSLELGVCTFRGTDEGTTFQHLSHNGPNNPNPSEYSPENVFARLFGAPPAPQVNAARRSVLDAVGQHIGALNTRLGAHDRVRLDQHLASIRDIELRLMTPVAMCNTPDPAADVPDVDGKEQIAEKNRAMSDMMAVALACDLTRAFSVMFSCAGSGVRIWQAGADNSLHQICHDEASPQPTVHAAVVYEMEQLAYFLAKLRDTPEGSSNLLENSSILCTTELSEGNVHSNDEFPILIAGKGSGRLRGNFHYRSPSSENTSKALLTALRAAGLPLESGFGYEAGHVTDPIGALLV
jgi:hypothetical protein